MKEIVSLFLIGISLSMDTFSLALSISSIICDNKLFKFFPFLVGIFHFIMPIIGNLIGSNIINLFNIAGSTILGLILIVLGVKLLIDYFKKEEINLNLNIFKLVLLAISVSIDSFTVGLGLKEITKNFLLAALVFASLSFSFTYIGIIIGKYSNKHIGKYAIFLGIILLLLLGIIHLL